MPEHTKKYWQATVLTSGTSFFEQFIDVVFTWGWLLMVILMLWIVWKLYMYIKVIDYVSSIQWSIIQITIPEDAVQTPKAMENFYAIIDGIHKSPDVIEKYFDGYVEAWYSCELHCTQNKARYIMVVPAVHKTFFEGVIYGQYPQAEIKEVEDYTQAYNYKDIDKTFDMFSTEMTLTDNDIYPIKTYNDYEDTLSEDDKFVDPHQSMIEAYTNVSEDDQFWIQILIRPIDAKDIKAWAQKGEEEIDKLAGKEVKREKGLLGKTVETATQIPAELIKAGVEGPTEAAYSKKSSLEFPKVSAGDTVKAEAIIRKISKGGYRAKIRLLYLAPLDKLTKPNIGRAIGAFKQFNSFNLNGFKPDSDTKTNGANYIMKQTRRHRKKRQMFLAFQWREIGGYEEGFMLSDEELATLYHFPTKFVKAPAIERAKAGAGGAPENIPYT